MTTVPRLAVTASCLGLLFSSPLIAAEGPTAAPEAGVVIERAPEPGRQAQEELAALREENRRLTTELETTRTASQRADAELARLRERLVGLESAVPTPAQQEAAKKAQSTIDQLNSRIRELEVALTSRTAELRDAKTVFAATKAAEDSANARVTAEKKRADETQARLTTLMPGLERLQAEKSALEAQLAEARKAEVTAREQLASAKQAPAPQPSPELETKLKEAEAKLADAQRTLSTLQAENVLLKTASADQARLAGELEKLRQEKAAQAAQPAPAPTPDATTVELGEKVADLENKLATALRSYTLLQGENEQLKAAGVERTAAADELANLRQQNADLEARLAAMPAAQPDLADRLAETENKLNTVLRSYSLLEQETEQKRSEAARAAEQAQATASQAASESAAKIAALFDELRQAQDHANTLAMENNQLRTRIALAGPPPGSLLASPSRPLPPAQTPAAADTSTSAAPATGVAAQPTGPRTHVVAPGDNLAKIARTYYGNANRWDDILNANRDVIQNENVLPIGVTLRIP